MSDYSIISVISGSVNAGDASNNDAVSPFIRPSEIGAMRYYRCDFGVRVAVSNELHTFISANGGTIHEDHMPNDYETFGWPKAILAASFSPISFRAVLGTNDRFRIWNQSVGEYEYSFSNPSQWQNGWSATGATIFCNDFGIGCPKGGGSSTSRRGWSNAYEDPSGYPVELPYANGSIIKGYKFSGSESEFINHMASLGYTYLGLLGNAPWAQNETLRDGYIYIGGLCLFNNSTAEDAAYWTDAAQIYISGLRELLDFYPWERRIDSIWKSLNRGGGPKQTRDTGLFRMSNNMWNPISNVHDENSTDNHGFRYDGGWKRSPKSGEGARR